MGHYVLDIKNVASTECLALKERETNPKIQSDKQKKNYLKSEDDICSKNYEIKSFTKN